MAIEFDPGYAAEPFRTLCAEYPDVSVYPPRDFRVEWGPIFHRGRLDGTARVLVLGQDPGQHESIARRILVGTAGQRVQGFLAKLGIDRSYVMINAFLYSVYGQGGGNRHKKNPAITAYRHRWLEALMAPERIDAVVAFGTLADAAWKTWTTSPAGEASGELAYVHAKHPTWPESSSKGDRVRYRESMERMLGAWNEALERLRPAVAHPDRPGPFEPYGPSLRADETPAIPSADLPAGLPAWMRGGKEWASRVGTTPKKKRAAVVVTVPSANLP
jgi:uracil-DNA glycosylase